MVSQQGCEIFLDANIIISFINFVLSFYLLFRSVFI